MIRFLFATALALLAVDGCAREGDGDVRFNGNGQQTRAFDLAGSTKNDRATKALVDARGRYLLVGYADPNTLSFARFLPNGNKDTAFGVDGKLSFGVGMQTVADAAIVPAGAFDSHDYVVVAGYAQKPSGPFLDFDPMVCRYLVGESTLQPDANVGSNGCRSYPIDSTSAGTDTISAMTIDDAGQIYLAGQTQMSPEDFDFLVIKLEPSHAALDPQFAGTGIFKPAFDIDDSHSGGDVDGATSILLAGNYLYVGGYAQDELGTDFAIAKIVAVTGAYDSTFCPAATCALTQATGGKRTIGYNLGGGNNDRLRAMAMRKDGLLTLAGEIEEDVSGTVYNDYMVTLLQANGAIYSFNGGVGARGRVFTDLQVTGLAVRDDNKIIVAGTTAASAGSSDPNRVLWATQLLAGGAADTNFASGLGGASPTALFLFPKADDTQPTDHVGGALSLDHGRILFAGARLWRWDSASNVFDYDFAIVRMSGDSIFTDGHEF